MKPAEAIELSEIRTAPPGELKQLRLDARITQQELAEICGVTHAAVSRWEDGQRTPRGEPARRYALFLAALRHRQGNHGSAA